MDYILSIDAGTTSVRVLSIDVESGQIVSIAQRPLPNYFPDPAKVEQDGAEIWNLLLECLKEISEKIDGKVLSIGITNQRETVITWDIKTGRLLSRALVWQDRRTTSMCTNLKDAGVESTVREKTGLVLDPYFSATKMKWIIDNLTESDLNNAVFGTVDTWILWNLTGGLDNGTFATEPSNASRTLLMDINSISWSESLCDIFQVPMEKLPEIKPSCGSFGTVNGEVLSIWNSLKGVEVNAILGDQQSALFGQCCFYPNMTKITYGTGSFLLSNVGASIPIAVDGLLTTIAWDLGRYASPGIAYALEGSIFSSGATVQWLRDSLCIINESKELEPLALEAETSQGVVLVPAFNGLGSPYWNQGARGAIFGISKGVGRSHIARAVLDSMIHQTIDVIEKFEESSNSKTTDIRVDGGASVMDTLLSEVATLSGSTVKRPKSFEATALGAARLSGLASGIYKDFEDINKLFEAESVFYPNPTSQTNTVSRDIWKRMVDKTLNFLD